MDEMRRRIIENCLEKEAAFCTSACPFGLDVREFVARMKRGSFNTAFRLYSNTVGFPAIVAALCDEPCKAVCPRDEVDAPISLRLLEDAAVAHAANRAPNSYNLPAKRERIAVVGAGISGLACALRLSNKKYRVDLFERSGRMGGGLWDELDPEVFLKDIELQFSNERYGLFLDRKITDIEELRPGYDAVYIATGPDGESFGLRPECPDGVPFASTLPGVFLGGGLLGAGRMEALNQGLKASLCIEDFFKTGAMRSHVPPPPTRMKLAPGTISRVPPITPSSGTSYTKEEAASEAARCIQCRCDACVRNCGMMNYFKKFPKRIEEEVRITITPGTLDGDGTVATRLISTCNQCGLCGEVCPEGIDVGEFLRGAHQAMHEKGAMPWAFHEFWLRDMDFSNSRRASLYAPPPSGAPCAALFFPGCQLGASDPRYVTMTYDFLLERSSGTALGLGCCGAPAIWAGDMKLFASVRERILAEWRELGEPQMILACPTCMTMFERYIPEVECRLLVDVLAESGVSPADRGNGAAVSVFDPCASRNMPDSQRAARDLVRAAGYELAPLPYEGKYAQCCSFGGHIDIAAPNYSAWLVDRRRNDGESPYVVYCSNCRDVLSHEGKRVRHVLDLFFGINDSPAPQPTFDERRRRRERLRSEMLSEYWPGLEPYGGEETVRSWSKLIMSPELREKMNRGRFLEEDALTAVERCEASGRRVKDPETGRFHGYEEIGYTTYWVEYEPSPEGFILHNAYSHRMKIELED
ncbi:MAG: Glutamate synthase (NADPH) small chain [Synergistetes bacterium ADurb.BinA166]|nr:MAG: Glutamate synthase (NADPH) small chain [Synergistetes bacterium ADurb.BinA166]